MIHVSQCESTQDLAWDCLSGTFVMADVQTGGRGRRAGRNWVSPPGGLYLSWRMPVIDPVGVALLGGLAVVRCLQEWGITACLKWPNDCWVKRQKIAGVLPDARWSGETCTGIVLGVGLNVHIDPVLLPENAVSMHQLLDEPPEITQVGKSLREQLSNLLAVHTRFGLTGYLDEVRSHSLPPGTAIRYWIQEEPFEGKIQGLDQQGFLLLESGERLTAVDKLLF